MRVLVVGDGGREHTLTWKIAQSSLVDKVYCVPGNAGIAQIAECVDIPLEEGFKFLGDFAHRKSVDLVVVGPEVPLAAGISDYLKAYWGLKVFGPSKAAAEIESSKAWAKGLMWEEKIPTAGGRIFMEPRLARNYIKEKGVPIVVKASGLAGGKGTFVYDKVEEALAAVQLVMVEKVFGSSGDTVVIEEFLEGEEATFTALTDGKTVLPLATSQDHKKLFEEDHLAPNPNTGGMGAISPAPAVDWAMQKRIMEEIIRPAIKGMAKRGRLYSGALYAGLMITTDGPKVLEFNCRLGDPEAQVILPRLESDLIPALMACTNNGTLHQIQLDWRPEPAVCVVMASGGYPQQYEKGKIITGLVEAEAMKNVTVFHAGTATNENGDFITNGGRVLGVTALGDSIPNAIDLAYDAVGKIHFDKAHYRRDIGHRSLKREPRKWQKGQNGRRERTWIPY